MNNTGCRKTTPAVVCKSIVPAASAPRITMLLSAAIVPKRPNPTLEAAPPPFPPFNCQL